MQTANTAEDKIRLLSARARHAKEKGQWPVLAASVREILSLDPNSAEGWFLAGLFESASNQPARARDAFRRALDLDGGRYDAAVELANQYSVARRNGDAAELLGRYEGMLDNSPVYLTAAGSIYTEIGLPQKAWPLFRRALELQPGVDLFQANLATCAVFLGKIDEAKALYKHLLERHPGHRQNHYQFSRLGKATDFSHVEEMKRLISESNDPPHRYIPLYYAIAKELEDLEQWEESFEFYRKAGDAATAVAGYDVSADIELIDTIIETCSADWLADTAGDSPVATEKTPVFIVGLPRTGTTLTERIVSSHSQVQTLGETLFLQMVLRQESGVSTTDKINASIIEAVAAKDMGAVGRAYLDAVAYRLDDEPLFIDKLPFNFLYLGFITRAWPQARIIHLVRNPMDSCFSMYKQMFTWAYKFSYSLDGLGRYYVAHHRLAQHWREVLGARMIEVRYEDLVSDQEGQTRRLLDRLGLPFEQACLEFDRNAAPSTTASSVQVRSKVHRGSVEKWKRFAQQLQPLREHLEAAGINVE